MRAKNPYSESSGDARMKSFRYLELLPNVIKLHEGKDEPLLINPGDFLVDLEDFNRELFFNSLQTILTKYKVVSIEWQSVMNSAIAKYLGECIANSKTLISFKINGYLNSDVQICAFTHGLNKLFMPISLENLDLSFNKFTDDGLRVLSEEFIRFRRLRELRLEGMVFSNPSPLIKALELSPYVKVVRSTISNKYFFKFNSFNAKNGTMLLDLNKYQDKAFDTIRSFYSKMEGPERVKELTAILQGYQDLFVFAYTQLQKQWLPIFQEKINKILENLRKSWCELYSDFLALRDYYPHLDLTKILNQFDLFLKENYFFSDYQYKCALEKFKEISKSKNAEQSSYVINSFTSFLRQIHNSSRYYTTACYGLAVHSPRNIQFPTITTLCAYQYLDNGIKKFDNDCRTLFAAYVQSIYVSKKFNPRVPVGILRNALFSMISGFILLSEIKQLLSILQKDFTFTRLISIFKPLPFSYEDYQDLKKPFGEKQFVAFCSSLNEMIQEFNHLPPKEQHLLSLIMKLQVALKIMQPHLLKISSQIAKEFTALNKALHCYFSYASRDKKPIHIQTALGHLLKYYQSKPIDQCHPSELALRNYIVSPEILFNDILDLDAFEKSNAQKIIAYAVKTLELIKQIPTNLTLFTLENIKGQLIAALRSKDTQALEDEDSSISPSQLM